MKKLFFISHFDINNFRRREQDFAAILCLIEGSDNKKYESIIAQISLDK